MSRIKEAEKEFSGDAVYHLTRAIPAIDGTTLGKEIKTGKATGWGSSKFLVVMRDLPEETLGSLIEDGIVPVRKCEGIALEDHDGYCKILVDDRGDVLTSSYYGTQIPADWMDRRLRYAVVEDQRTVRNGEENLREVNICVYKSPGAELPDMEENVFLFPGDISGARELWGTDLKLLKIKRPLWSDSENNLKYQTALNGGVGVIYFNERPLATTTSKNKYVSEAEFTDPRDLPFPPPERFNGINVRTDISYIFSGWPVGR